MPAEGMPRTESSLLGGPLRALTALVIRFPVTTMLVAGLLAAGALVAAQHKLKFNTSRADLLNPNSEYHHRWLEYTQEFGGQEDVVVVVQGEGREAIVPVLEEIAACLGRERKHFRSVFHKIDPTKLQAKGLHYLDPPQLQEIEGFLNQAQPVLQGDWAALNVGGQLAWFCRQLEHGDPRQLQALIQNAQQEQSQALTILGTALGQAGPYHSPWPDTPSPPPAAQNEELRGGYLLADNDRTGMVLLWLEKDRGDNFAEYSSALGTLREIVARTKARYPHVAIGLTGLPVMENDEMESSQTSMMQAGILSFLGVALLYVAGFGCIRHPLMAVIALLIPMAWSFGYITLVVGHLNILSSAFATIVIGLGSDFGVYHIAQYLRLRKQSLSTRDALLETARSVGPGITTGALSTAVAFFVIGLTDFPGVAELGIVAGGGILLCWISALTLLPAMIHWSDSRRKLWRVPAPLDIYVWMKPIMSRPRFVLVTFLAGTALVGAGVGRLWYDHNLLNLQAVGLESVELEKQLLRQDKISASFAVSIATTREEVVARKQAFQKLPSVERVREIATCLPDNESLKRPVIERIHRRLANLPESPPTIPVVPPGDLDRALARLEQFMVAGERAEQIQAVRQIRGLIRSIPEQEYYGRLRAFQQAMAADLLGRLVMLRAAASPEPPQWSDLPEGLVSRFVGRGGCYLMQIYSKADIWNMEDMEQFVQQVRSVDAGATGNPMQIYESSRQMKRSYEQAAWYALIVVVFIVYLDFRSIRNTLLALLPLGIAMLQLFGLMGLLAIPLNPANMIVLPLILGVGVDTGVHIVHDYLREPRPYRINGSTAAAILVNTLMNIVGFGSLMIASHRGLHSLGRVLTIGMACVLVSGLVMPSFLRLLQMVGGTGRGAKPLANPELGSTHSEPCDPVLSSEPETVPIRRRLEAAA